MSIPDEKRWIVYALRAPGDPRIRYVGLAGYLCVRLGTHVAFALKARRDGGDVTPKDAWILSILDADQEPEIHALERGSGPGGTVRERHWIARLRAEGADLLNADLGAIAVRGWARRLERERAWAQRHRARA